MPRKHRKFFTDKSELDAIEARLSSGIGFEGQPYWGVASPEHLAGAPTPSDLVRGGSQRRAMAPLLVYLGRVPSVSVVSCGFADDGNWWVKLKIDIDHALAWQVVQEFGYVLNGISMTERLPTIFFPTSPPPYLNGDPRKYLAWAIESKTPDFNPEAAAEWLWGRLPRPVHDLKEWRVDDE